MSSPPLAKPQQSNKVPSDQIQKKQQIGQLITHLAKSDNHLWQALTFLQTQVNGIINQTTDWISWTPTIKDDLKVPLVFDEITSYYMISGQALFVDFYVTKLTITSNATQILIDLPADIGETVKKTCAAYLMALQSDGTPNVSLGNGVVFLEAQKQLVAVYVNPTFRGLTCRFAMGGATGIIQTSGVITTPPR